MKVLFTVLLILISISAQAKVSTSTLKQVYYRLCKINGYCPPLYVIINDNYINAEASCNRVYIYTGMLRFLDNKDQLALILGHELGHIYNKDCRGFHTYTKEYHADQYGANLMTKAGFNRCKGVRQFKKFIRVFGDDTSLTHPMDSLRFNRINYGCTK
jgi:predicted Zn-dependent protease